MIACSISPCGRYVATVSNDPKHSVTIYNIKRKVELATLPGNSNVVLDLAWSKRPDDLRFGVVGSKELTFWHPSDITRRISQKGTFGKAQ